jgi:hypothetical protein
MISALIAKYEVVLGAIVLIIVLTLGWYVHGVFIAAAREKVLNAEISQHIELEKLANAKAADLEKELAKARTQNAKENENIKNEVKKPAYNCIVPSSGRMLINAAATNTAAR